MNLLKGRTILDTDVYKTYSIMEDGSFLLLLTNFTLYELSLSLKGSYI